jgi:hypothetical protein
MTAETIARALGLRRVGRQFTGRCPGCGYASGFTVAQRSGAILLYCHAGGCSQAELWGALEQVGLGHRKGGWERRPIGHRVTKPQSGELSDDPARNQAPALAIWQRTQPVYGTIVETYLREARGYTGPIAPTLRFATGKHPSAPKRWHPIMVAAVLLDDRIVAVHRTFLREDGRGKADLDPDKMTLGRAKAARCSWRLLGGVSRSPRGLRRR